MPMPAEAALDRIFLVLQKRRTRTVGDDAAWQAIETVLEATGRRFADDDDTTLRLELIDYLENLGARFDPPDGDGQVWAHWKADGLERSLNVSAPNPGEALRRIGLGLP